MRARSRACRQPAGGGAALSTPRGGRGRPQDGGKVSDEERGAQPRRRPAERSVSLAGWHGARARARACVRARACLRGIRKTPCKGQALSRRAISGGPRSGVGEAPGWRAGPCVALSRSPPATTPWCDVHLAPRAPTAPDTHVDWRHCPRRRHCPQRSPSPSPEGQRAARPRFLRRLQPRAAPVALSCPVRVTAQRQCGVQMDSGCRIHARFGRAATGAHRSNIGQTSVKRWSKGPLKGHPGRAHCAPGSWASRVLGNQGNGRRAAGCQPD